MAEEREPGSLQFHLEQLQQIEQERIEAEREQEERRREVRRRATLEAQLVEDEARRHTEAEELERMRQEQRRRQQQLEEHQRRVEAAERQTLDEVEARLLAHHNDVHTQTLREHKAHHWQAVLAGIGATAMLICAGLGHATYQNKREIAQAEATRTEQQQLLAALTKELDEAQDRARVEAERGKQLLAEIEGDIKRARTAAEKELLRERSREQARIAAEAKKRAAQREAAQRRRDRMIAPTRSDDPLGEGELLP